MRETPEPMMSVVFRLGEPFWRSVGERRVQLEVAQESTVGAALDLLCRRFPDLRQEMDETPPEIFVGREQADLSTLLAEGAEIHLVWAVSGG